MADLPPLCEIVNCEGLAIFIVCWPGKPPTRMCLVDGAKVSAIAEAMGFKLDIKVIPGASISLPVGGGPPSLRALLEID